MLLTTTRDVKHSGARVLQEYDRGTRCRPAFVTLAVRRHLPPGLPRSVKVPGA